MTGTRLAIVFSLAAGIAGAAQASISGALGRRVGTIGAAGLGVVLAAILVVALAVALGRGGSIVSALHEPLWLWLGGLFGAVIVLAIAYAPPRIGTFATVALLIAGQLASGALIDAYGWLGSPRIPVTLARVAGLVLVTVGAALTLKR
ncbi:MAG TPA: DMT family transporter [Actinomycetota bacterium]|nr:DMT family transporter [Actinomycetota bacterium]